MKKIDILFIFILIITLNIFITLICVKFSKKYNTDEKFIVADANDIHNYDVIKDHTLQDENNFNEQLMKNPPLNYTVDYDKYKDDKDDFYIGLTYNADYPKKFRKEKDDKKFVSQADFGWEPPVNYVSCSNSSIVERYKTGEKRLMPYQPTCGHPNNLTAENYYKTHYWARSIPMDNNDIRGSNYDGFGSYPTPTQTKYMRILSQNTKGLPRNETQSKNLPIGYNYSFHNTPVMPMI